MGNTGREAGDGAGVFGVRRAEPPHEIAIARLLYLRYNNDSTFRPAGRIF